MRDRLQAQLPTPPDFVPWGGLLSEGLLLGARGSVRVRPGLEKGPACPFFPILDRAPGSIGGPVGGQCLHSLCS